MPYGCAIKDYSSGLCQPPSAHYKPYARSTAVSPHVRKVATGACGQLVPGPLVPGRTPSPSESLPWRRTGWGSGRREGGDREDGPVGLACAEQAGHEGRWHKTAPRAPNGQHLPTPWEPPARNELLTGSWKRFLLAVLAQLVAPGTRVPLDTGDSPVGTWGSGLGQTWPGLPPPAVSKPSAGLLG